MVTDVFWLSMEVGFVISLTGENTKIGAAFQSSC